MRPAFDSTRGGITLSSRPVKGVSWTRWPNEEAAQADGRELDLVAALELAASG